ncbi:MAG: response regulator [Candidatus Scalinduaceae bacterium]
MEEAKIILLENDPDHAELIIDILKFEDIKNEIILVKDGQEAIEYFQKEKVNGSNVKQFKIGLVILDLNLPKVNGIDILKFLKSNPQYISIPVVVLSASSDEETISKAYSSGANDYITKPIYYEEFVEKIRVLMECQFSSKKLSILK